MKTKSKRFSIALVLLGAIVIGWLLCKKDPPPQIITLPNGEKYEFAGVTWGREAVPPTLDAQVVHRLPAALGNWLRNRYPKRLSQMNLGDKYPEPRFFIWYRHVGTNVSSRAYQENFIPRAVLADEAGVKGGSLSSPNFESSVTWSFDSFRAVPRRSRMLQCQFYPSPYGQEAYSPFSAIRFPNPLYGQFPQWQAEPLPIVKHSGDLEVRLDALTSGHPDDGPWIVRSNGSRAVHYSPIAGGKSIQSAIDFSVRSAKGTNEIWVANRLELSDATGNVLVSSSFRPEWLTHRLWLTQGSKGLQFAGWIGYCETVEGTLWPDEAVWRLKVELKRTNGFAPTELVTFKSVPILPLNTTNSIWITNTVGGLQVRLEEHRREGWWKLGDYPKFRLEAPDGFIADVIQVTTDAGEELDGGGGFEYTNGTVAWPLQPFISVRIRPTNTVNTLNITWAVQKTRTVEFFVKPPQPQ